MLLFKAAKNQNRALYRPFKNSLLFLALALDWISFLITGQTGQTGPKHKSRARNITAYQNKGPDRPSLAFKIISNIKG
jgi:hypothetical protein